MSKGTKIKQKEAGFGPLKIFASFLFLPLCIWTELHHLDRSTYINLSKFFDLLVTAKSINRSGRLTNWCRINEQLSRWEICEWKNSQIFLFQLKNHPFNTIHVKPLKCKNENKIVTDRAVVLKIETLSHFSNLYSQTSKFISLSQISGNNCTYIARSCIINILDNKMFDVFANLG